MTALPPGETLWTPAHDARETTRLGRYMTWLREEGGLAFDGYEDLWTWSVSDLDAFWRSIWDHFDVVAHAEPTAVLGARTMPGAEWFPGARLNYAENVLRAGGDDEIAIVAHSQTRGTTETTRGELRAEVRRVREGLRRLGVGPGDRVAGYVANTPEAVVGLLASASLGAIWAACPPEFGTQSVLDRIRQIDPKVLIAVDGYRYGEKVVDRSAVVQQLRDELPHLAGTVAIPYLDPDGPAPAGTVPWAELRAIDAPMAYESVAFDHPLWILFSSGTTGLPKPIMHGHGGIVLEHLKMGALQQDLGPGDRFLFFSTTGWMVWNRVVSALMVGASVVLIDGDPTYPELDQLFRTVADDGVTVWGVSATYLMMCRESGVVPRERYDLSRLRAMFAAGSPVPIEGYRYVYADVAPHAHFYSGSGGTDICSGICSGTPITPVTAGEISARMLGVAAHAFGPDATPVIDEVGELVITEPMPSMPVGFWGDTDGSRQHGSYFDVFPGVWRHGDRFVVSSRGTCNVTGRSDATLNRGGVRLGTGEIYDVVERLPEVQDSVAVHLEGQAGGRGDLLLFVVLHPDAILDEDLRRRMARELRSQRSPRHVPDEVYAVAAVPRTLTGKKLEVPVKRVMQGADVETVASRGALLDPDAMDVFVALAAERAGREALR